tara:strand:+ start:134 stop:889 length:756 start_codon:yes stop_codon:yes gene_type:complete
MSLSHNIVYPPLVTIVTVVKNDIAHIESTILSVIKQTYPNIEYIIIDGGSTDGTMEIIEKYSKQINYKISERDNGIYDAMNKGFEQSSGDWINFLNSGDLLHDDHVLENIAFNSHKDNCFLYGNYRIRQSDGTIVKTMKSLNMNRLNLALFGTRAVCHQAIFYNTKIKFRYPKNYSLKGELFSYFEYLKFGKPKYVKCTICDYLLGGEGYRSRVQNRKEAWRVIRENMGFLCVLYAPMFAYQIIMGLIKKK